MNLAADLQRLYLSEEDFVDAKTLLQVPKITGKEKMIMEEWVDKGYLKVSSGGNKQLYGLAEGGKRFLQRNNPQLWPELVRDKARLDCEKIRSVLEVIAKKDGKTPLTAAEQKKLARYLDMALAEKLVEPSGAESYQLTEVGKTRLAALEPIGEILKKLESCIRTVEEEVNRPTQAYNGFIEQFSAQQPHLKAGLDELFSKFRQNLGDARENLTLIAQQVENVQLARQIKELLTQDIQQTEEFVAAKTKEIQDNIATCYAQWQEAQQKKISEAQQALYIEYRAIWQKLDNLEKLYERIAQFHEQK